MNVRVMQHQLIVMEIFYFKTSLQARLPFMPLAMRDLQEGI
jgi:hypothetical protein